VTAGFIYAIVILGLPTLVLATGVAGVLRTHDDATRALSVPVAYACLVICGVVAVRLGIRGQALTAVTIGPALVGGALLMRWRGWRSLPLWPLLGAALTLAILATPYQSHKAGVLGWNIGNDSVIHVTYADALAMPDRAPIAGSSAHAVVETFAGGYPEGSHALLAAVLAFTRDPLTSFNPVLAVLMAFAAFPAFWLIRRQLASAPLAAIGAAGAAGGYLQFGFYTQGFLPQLAVTALLFGALAFGYEALAAASLALAAMAGVTAAAAVVVYSAAIGVYLGPAAVLALVALAVSRGIPRRLRIGLPAIALGAGLVALLPELGRTLDLARSAAGAAGDPTSFVGDRGNLPGPVDKLTVLGTWIGPDYRVPYLYVRPTHIAMIAAASLAAVAVLVALRHRRFALPAILAAVGVGALYVAANSSIYYTAKTYQVASFPIACAVVAGAAALTRCPWPRLGIPLALAGALLLGGVGAAVKLGTGMAARAAAVTPVEFRQLQTLGLHSPHRLGVALISDAWAKALLPDAALPFDASFGADVRPGSGFAGVLDVDSLQPPSLAGVSWIAEQRLGGASTPPSAFRLTDVTMAYRMWTRAPGSSPLASHTLPFEPATAIGGVVLAPGHTVAAPATGLLVGRAADGTLAFPVRWKLPGTGWGPWVAYAIFVVPSLTGGPPATAPIEIGAGGRYLVSLIGQPSAGMRIRVDGTTLPPPDTSALGTFRYAPVGVARLAPGRHTLSLVAGGNGQIAYILAISLERIGADPPVAICVGDRRERLARGISVKVRQGQRISACGGRAVLLDRIVEAS
jgi:hypothetical protein